MENDCQNSEAGRQPADPGLNQVRDFLIYGVSLPERVLRSTAAMAGGAVTESAELLVPQAFRDSTSYKTFVQQMLDMVVRDVGGVKSDEADVSEEDQVEDYVARKTVGGFLDFAGLATLHLSPVLVLAVVSDLAYGSRTYLDELAVELKKEGVIAPDSTIDNVAELLDAIGEVSSETAELFDTPPINIAALRSTVEETADKIARMDPSLVLPKNELDKMWSDMQEVSVSEGVGLLEVSSAMTMYALNQVDTVRKGALTTIMVSGELLDRHVLSHYWEGLGQISERGLYTIVAESSQPYIEAVWENFSTDRPTVTEDLLTGKLVGKVWTGMRGWLGGSADD